MNRSRYSIIALVLSAGLLTGCVSTTQIQSRPQGAQIIMDNTIKLGQTPVELREMVWVWTQRRFEARMPGYKDTVFVVEKEYPWAQNLVVCLCSGLIMWPVMLASKYTQRTVVTLTPAGATSAPQPVVEQPKLAFDTK